MNYLTSFGWHNLVRNRGSKEPWDIVGKTPGLLDKSTRASENEIKQLKDYAKKFKGCGALAYCDEKGKVTVEVLGNQSKKEVKKKHY